MARGAGSLDRRVQILRRQGSDDGLGMTYSWAAHGPLIAAQKTDVSDGEAFRAAQVQASLSARFVLRWSSFTAAITPKDRLTCEGVTYEITGGPRETGGRRRYLEISAAALPEGAQ